MDFFHAQDAARRNTAWLILLFLLAVTAILLGVYSVIVVVVSFSGEYYPYAPTLVWWRPELFWPVAAVTCAIIGGGSLYKAAQLARGGGRAVAESLGARRVARASEDLKERRLLNVVDEMAIAAGVPVPAVYLLEQEQGINAFAAGIQPNQAVVAVTRGALEQLSRDELQGVVAHEFSHIFNGDMRINLRLMGVLHGILLIALLGRALLEGSSRGRSRNAGGIVVLGLALLVVGYVGVLFGRMIKAAVSRQREYLADAAAVQYTRNPGGIAGALKKIAGFGSSRILHPRAEEASHMFFGEGLKRFSQLLATHPPIEARIRRLDPSFKALAGMPGGGGAELAPGIAALAAAPSAVRASVGNGDARHLDYARELLARLPESVTADLHRPEHARELMYALLAAADPAPEALLAQVTDSASAKGARAHVAWLRSAGRAVRLPLVELALPALAELPREQIQLFLAEMDRLCRLDQRITLFEFVLMTLLRDALEPRRAPGPGRRHELPVLRQDLTLLLSLLAHAGHQAPAAAASAFSAATALAPLDGPWAMLAENQLSVAKLDAAFERLALTPFRFRGRVVEACVAAVNADNKVTVNEAELLRAVGARLHCPVPPLLPALTD